ncbi:MAG: AAA family ATPase [Bacteroidales bacterium]|jgi:predicted AAA+ superfamily ATPase|nr:AAA family ATPase [Bacteroidales bacterium]
MQELYTTFEELLSRTPLEFKRYIYLNIDWSDRMFGIVGPRGVGKTMLVLQHIKENHNINDTLYVSMDDIYFANHTLKELVDKFQKNGGKYLFIDEIHKYPEWSRTLKNIYDFYPKINVVFTGSSILDILKGTADLSRRVILKHLQGLSFREYLQMFHNISVPLLSIKDILANKANEIKSVIDTPVKYFNDYLQNGYYPFGNMQNYNEHLKQIIVHTMETDIPLYANMNVSTGRKLLKLLVIIADSVPFKPNLTKFAKLIEASKNSLSDYLYLIEKAGMIAQLREKGEGLLMLGKVEKIYLDNPNLAYCLSEKEPEIGNIRETVFLNQMRVKNKVYRSEKADFTINNMTFEVGGKSKNQKQIEGLKKAYIVKDDIEYGYKNTIPLWAFGLNY